MLQDSEVCGIAIREYLTFSHNQYLKCSWSVHCDVHEPETRYLTGINSTPAFASGVSVIFWLSALVCGFFLTHAQSSCQHSTSMEIISIHRARNKSLHRCTRAVSGSIQVQSYMGAEPEQKQKSVGLQSHLNQC